MSNIELTEDERAEVELARNAFSILKKTFATWLVVGRGIGRLRAKANRLGGRKAFIKLMEENGFGELLDKKHRAIVSNLETILKPENLPKVEEWHAALSPIYQSAWASPKSVLRHCPVFAKPEDGDTAENGEQDGENGEPKTHIKKRTVSPELAAALHRIDELEIENEGYKEQVSELEAARETAAPVAEQAEQIDDEAHADIAPPAPKNPLKGLTFDVIADFVLELPKSTVRAVAHELGRALGKNVRPQDDVVIDGAPEPAPEPVKEPKPKKAKAAAKPKAKKAKAIAA